LLSFFSLFSLLLSSFSEQTAKLPLDFNIFSLSEKYNKTQPFPILQKIKSADKIELLPYFI